jgi:hypothetical protein
MPEQMTGQVEYKEVFVPDFTLIQEVMLFSNGLLSATDLAAKMTVAFERFGGELSK